MRYVVYAGSWNKFAGARWVSERRMTSKSYYVAKVANLPRRDRTPEAFHATSRRGLAMDGKQGCHGDKDGNEK